MYSTFSILQTDYLVGGTPENLMQMAPFHAPRAEIDDLSVGEWTGVSPTTTPSGNPTIIPPPAVHIYSIECDVATTIWNTNSPNLSPSQKSVIVEFCKQGRVVVGRTTDLSVTMGTSATWGGIIEPTGIYTITLTPKTTLPSALIPIGHSADAKTIPLSSRLAYQMDVDVNGDFVFYNAGTVAVPNFIMRHRMYNPTLTNLETSTISTRPCTFSYIAAN